MNQGATFDVKVRMSGVVDFQIQVPRRSFGNSFLAAPRNTQESAFFDSLGNSHFAGFRFEQVARARTILTWVRIILPHTVTRGALGRPPYADGAHRAVENFFQCHPKVCLQVVTASVYWS